MILTHAICRQFLCFLPFAVALFFIGCAAGTARAAEPGAPVAADDGWPVARAADAGFDAAALAQLSAGLRGGRYPNSHAVLVAAAGRLVYEIYLAGEDQRWGTSLGHVSFDQESLHDLRSVSKSVTSALLGIALARHDPEIDFAAAVARPLADYFPDMAGKFGPGVGEVTLQQVLTMTAGLQWNEMTVPYTDRENDEIRLYYTEDPVAMVLARPLVDTPGDRWYYNGGLTQVIAGLIERLTGKPLDAFAEEALFAPLGITDYEWLGSSLWPRGSSPSAASGLRLRTRDLAKIGMLFLENGRWQGKQVVPAAWIELSTRRHVRDIPWGAGGLYGYGFMWYPGHREGDPKSRVIRALGNGDQRLFILPDEGLVVTVFAGVYNRFDLANGERILAALLAARE